MNQTVIPTCPRFPGQWNWNSLSKIVQQINQSGVWTAELLVQDVPAMFLSRQSNAGVGMPYECVVSEVGLIGLTEPSLPTVAATPSGSLAYQVREYLQSFSARDRCHLDQVFRCGNQKRLSRGREADGHRSMAGCAGAEPGLRSGPAIGLRCR